MSPYPWGAALTNLWVTALVVVATFAVALFVAVRVRGGRHDGIDVVWGMGFAIVAIVTLVLARGAGDLWRQVLITVLTCVWGLRLAVAHRAAQPGQARGPALRRDHRAGEGQPGRAPGAQGLRAAGGDPVGGLVAGAGGPVRVRVGRPLDRRDGARRAVVGGRALLRDGRRRPARRVHAPTRPTRAG